MTDPSIHGAKQKSRRCFPKESSVLGKRIAILFKRSDDAKRKQSIYSQILLNCYAVGGNNTGPKHSKIIVFPLGFREAFSLLPFCLCGFIWSNTMKLWGFGKDTCFSDEIQCPYEDSYESLSHSWQRRGSFPIYPNCHNVWIEWFNTIPARFLLSLYLLVWLSGIHWLNTFMNNLRT